MAENRIPREAQNREQSARPKAWRPPELLPEPTRQAGYAYRWIRVSLMNNADPRNISARLREGWEPVGVEEQPQMKFFLDPKSQFKDNIEVGGLLLCKAPAEMVQQRNDYYANQNARQADAVDNNFMRQSDARMPLFAEKKSTSTRGFGNGS
jgi:hypothetical protein